MSKPLQQIISDAVADFVTQRKTATEIVADIKQNFALQDELLAVTDALLASPHPELRAAGKLIEGLALGWTRETSNDYLRGTNILADKSCICVDPNAVDKTCPAYGTSDHGKIIARRWIDELMRG